MSFWFARQNSFAEASYTNWYGDEPNGGEGENCAIMVTAAAAAGPAVVVFEVLIIIALLLLLLLLLLVDECVAVAVEVVVW